MQARNRSVTACSNWSPTSVAQRVVDGLEVVEVQEQDADVTLFAVGAVNGLS
jgi:hypothetical protein